MQLLIDLEIAREIPSKQWTRDHALTMRLFDKARKQLYEQKLTK